MSTLVKAPTLRSIKIAQTVIWAFFVSCILAIWVFAWQALYAYAALMIGIVLIEVIVLSLNDWRCPLTSIAARYTDERVANFDIYLPVWIARIIEITRRGQGKTNFYIVNFVVRKKVRKS